MIITKKKKMKIIKKINIEIEIERFNNKYCAPFCPFYNAETEELFTNCSLYRLESGDLMYLSKNKYGEAIRCSRCIKEFGYRGDNGNSKKD